MAFRELESAQQLRKRSGCLHLQILRCFRGPVYLFFVVLPCLWRGKYFSSGREPAENQVTPMLRHLIYKIKATGPITVAEYMKEVLTNPAKVRVGEPEDQAAPAASRGVSQEGCAPRCPRVLRASSSGAFSRGRAIPRRVGDREINVPGLVRHRSGQGQCHEERRIDPKLFRRQCN